MREKGEEEGEEDKVQGEREEEGYEGMGVGKRRGVGEAKRGGDNGNIWNIGEGNGIRNGGTLQ